MAGRAGGYGNREIFDAGLAVRSNRGQGRIYDRFRRRIMFPLADARGRVLGFGARALGADQKPKYLNSSDGEIFHKGEIVYGAHLARTAAARADEVIATEGYMDVLALHQAGIVNVVCIMGTSLTERQVGELAKLGKTVLLALDADSAGQEAMLKAAKVAARSKLALRVVPLPDGLDPADVVQQRGVEAAARVLPALGPVRALPGRARAGARRPDRRRGQGQGDRRAAAGVRDAAAERAARGAGRRRHRGRRAGPGEGVVVAVDAGRGGGPRRLPAGRAAPMAQAAPPQRQPYGGGRNGGGGGWQPRRSFEPDVGPARRKGSQVAQAERAFLAQCVVTPSLARDLLPKLDKATFSSEFMGRLATHLEGNLEEPSANIDEGDDLLRNAVSGLIADSAGLTQLADGPAPRAGAGGAQAPGARPQGGDRRRRRHRGRAARQGRRGQAALGGARLPVARRGGRSRSGTSEARAGRGLRSHSSGGGTRTHNPSINSRMLCH